MFTSAIPKSLENKANQSVVVMKTNSDASPDVDHGGNQSCAVSRSESRCDHCVRESVLGGDCFHLTFMDELYS